MPVEAQTVEYAYLGDGVSTAFSFPAYFLSNSDILVGLNGVQQNSGFTVAGGGNPSGGTVTFAVAPAVGVRVALVRRPPLSQSIDFTNGGTVLEEVLDRGLDKLTMIAQFLNRTDGRSLRLGDLDVTPSFPALPEAPDRANKVLVFDADGAPAVDGNVPDLLNAVGASQAAAADAAGSATAAAGSAAAAAASAAAAGGSASAAAASAASISLPIPVASGGTGSTTAAGARVALGFVSGLDGLWTAANAGAARVALGFVSGLNALWTAANAGAARAALGFVSGLDGLWTAADASAARTALGVVMPLSVIRLTGLTGTPTIRSTGNRLGTLSASRAASGNYTLSWVNNVTNIHVQITPFRGSTPAAVREQSETGTSVTFQTVTPGNTNADPDGIDLVIWGTL